MLWLLTRTFREKGDGLHELRGFLEVTMTGEAKASVVIGNLAGLEPGMRKWVHFARVRDRSMVEHRSSVSYSPPIHTRFPA